jgi:hypothetical protein
MLAREEEQVKQRESAKLTVDRRTEALYIPKRFEPRMYPSERPYTPWDIPCHHGVNGKAHASYGLRRLHVSKQAYG